MEKSITSCPIKIFVFGTLRKKGRLDYYMDGSKYAGKYYTEGQLMKSELGSAYIDFNYKDVASIGELYYINYPGLLRINHLESTSGEFPKGYDLALLPIWKLGEDGKHTYSDEDKSYAFFYKRRNDPIKIMSGDWINRTRPIEEIKKIIEQNSESENLSETVVDHMREYLINEY